MSELGKLASLNPADVIFSAMKIRDAKKDTKQYEWMKYSIAEVGVDTPIRVRPFKDEYGKEVHGKYEGIDGCQRWSCSKDLGLTTIPAYIKDMSDNEARSLQMLLNRARVPQTKAEELRHVRVYMGLTENIGKSHKQIAIELAMDPAELSNLLSLEKLSPAADAALKKELISPSAATAISRLPIHDQDYIIDNLRGKSTTDILSDCARITAENRKKDDPSHVVVATLRRKTDIQDEHDRLEEEVNRLAPSEDTWAFKSGVLHGLKWALKLDQDSLAENEKRRQERKTRRMATPEDQLEMARRKVKELEEQLNLGKEVKQLVESLA